MESVLKTRGIDVSQEIEEEPEIIENNVLARGESWKSLEGMMAFTAMVPASSPGAGLARGVLGKKQNAAVEHLSHNATRTTI